MNLISPCLVCELLKEDKNNPECMNCKKRIEYVLSQGHPGASLPENIKMDGEAGKNLEELEKMIEEKSKTEKLNNFDSVEEYIDLICEQESITKDQLMQDKKNKDVSKIRKQIAFGLKENFDLKNAEIAKALNLSQPSIWHLFNSDSNKKSAKPNIIPAPAPEKLTSKSEKEISNDHMILIKFEDHLEIYEKLIAMAADQFRTPEKQILFMLKETFRATEIQKSIIKNGFISETEARQTHDFDSSTIDM